MSEDGFEPVMAIPFGLLLGVIVGLLLGPILEVDVGRTLVAGMITGLLLGTVVYALLQSDEDDEDERSGSR